MISIQIDTRELEGLARGTQAGIRRALKRAFQGEAVRLREVASAKLAGGVGPHTAELTQLEQARKKAKELALHPFGRFVAYQVDDVAGRPITARIGMGVAVSRSKNADGRKKQFVTLFSGGTHRITKEEQARIAYKIRKRWGEPVMNPQAARPYGKRWHSRRQAHAAGRRKWRKIPRVLIPKVGRVLTWPERDYVAQVIRSEHLSTRANISMLFGKAIRGERWEKRWW